MISASLPRKGARADVDSREDLEVVRSDGRHKFL